MGIDKIMIIDGGFATQLTVHVGLRVDGDPLWSARFNSTNPNAVIETHLDFLRNGADAILTNTYQASIEGHMEYLKMNEKESIELIKSTVQLAHNARNKYMEEQEDKTKIPLIVGSIGPYGAHLHDGSEYSGDYADRISVETIQNWHRIRINAIMDVGVDALAIETIPCLIEAEALVDLIAKEYPNTKFWISFQCKDGSSLAHGELFKDACLTVFNKVKELKMKNFIAIGVNCVNPQFVTPLFESLNGNRSDNEKLPLVVYPNSGEVYDVINGWTGREDCVPLENYISEWIDLGAIIIGGCCRTYAADIKQIKLAVMELNLVN